MLGGLRRAGQSWLGRIIVAIMFGFLIVSFAIWGIGDIFRGAPRNTVAIIGDTEISGETFRQAYQTELQLLNRRARRTLTPQEVQAYGLEQRVLSRLVAEAALDNRANSLGLAVSDRLVADSIRTDPSFNGPNGFDRARFEAYLGERAMNEQMFVREHRATVARSQLAQSVLGDIAVPLAMREAVQIYGAERRSADAILLPASAAGEIATPSEDELKKFYEERKSSFRAPEYRTANIVVLNAQTVMKPDAVADADIRQRYEQTKNTRFGQSERRTIEQLTFPTFEEAEAAAKRIAEGATFEAVAAERNATPESLALGTFTKDQMFDQAIADAAFALEEGKPSGAIRGRFDNVIVRAAKIEPAALKPFEEVAGELRNEIAQERARSSLQDVHDQVEDQRVSAKPLTEIARERSLPITTVTTDREAKDPADGQLTLPLPERVVPAIFSTDIGADSEALRTDDGGYIWIEVTKVDPARERTLEEARAQASELWKSETIAKRLADKALGLVQKLESGTDAAAAAAEAGLEAKSITDISRGSAKEGLSIDSVARIFATPVGKVTSAPAAENGRVVFKVTAATAPPLVTTTNEAATTEERLRQMLADDLLNEYVAEAQSAAGIRIFPDAVRRAIGGEPL